MGRRENMGKEQMGVVGKGGKIEGGRKSNVGRSDVGSRANVGRSDVGSIANVARSDMLNIATGGVYVWGIDPVLYFSCGFTSTMLPVIRVLYPTTVFVL